MFEGLFSPAHIIILLIIGLLIWGKRFPEMGRKLRNGLDVTCSRMQLPKIDLVVEEPSEKGQKTRPRLVVSIIAWGVGFALLGAFFAGFENPLPAIIMGLLGIMFGYLFWIME